MTEQPFDDVTDLSRMRELLAPRAEAAERIVAAALEGGRPAPGFRPAVAIFCAATVVLLFAILRVRSPRAPIPRIGNAGGVVFASGGGRSWIVSGTSASVRPVKRIEMPKGEIR